MSSVFVSSPSTISNRPPILKSPPSHELDCQPINHDYFDFETKRRVTEDGEKENIPPSFQSKRRTENLFFDKNNVRRNENLSSVKNDVRRNENQIVYTENDYVVKKDDHRRRYYSDDDDDDDVVAEQFYDKSHCKYEVSPPSPPINRPIAPLPFKKKKETQFENDEIYYTDDDDFDQPVYLPREGWKNKRDLDWIVIGPKYWCSPVIEIYELRASLDYQVIFLKLFFL